MKTKILGLLSLASILTLGLASVNENSLTIVDAAEKTVTISFASTDQRTVFNPDQQVWEQNGITVTNNQASSTSAMANYANPVRFYKSTQLIVEYTSNISSIEFDCNSASYATALKNSITTGETITVNSDKVTVALDGAAKSFEVTLTGGQVRMDAISVTYTEASSGGEEPVVPTPTPVDTSVVKGLFEEYYNNGTYTKASELKVNAIAQTEVAKYFHASADVKYRKTEYTPEGLSMTISEDGVTYGNVSTYENYNGQVKHTGLGGDYFVNKTSVEDWFVTLHDFNNSSLDGWKVLNGVYSYDLPLTTYEDGEINENAMTRMAREFVAPMWLAPSTENYAYALFNKLTVQKVNKELVMNLYVSNASITDNAEGLFSQVKISYVPSVITSIADALAASGTGEEVAFTGVRVSKEYYSWNGYQMSFYVTDGQKEIIVFQCATKVAVGDIIDVSGVLGVYNNVPQVAKGSTVTITTPHTCSYLDATCTTPATCSACGAYKDNVTAEHKYVDGLCSCGEKDPDYEGEVVLPQEEKLTVKATAGSLASDKLSISWSAQNYTLLVEKHNSTTAIRTSDSDHFRVYQDTKTTISGSNITKVVITVTESKYASVLASSLTTTGVTASYSGTTVTFTVDSGTIDSLVITAKGQWRLSSMTVWYLADQ